MRVAVASGKGGTGKTTVAVNLAAALATEGDVEYVDCDVEEPNGRIFLKPVIEREFPVTLPAPQVDYDRCNGCGRCAGACAFRAIVLLGDRPAIFPEMCHGCGACADSCPTGALREEARPLGTVSTGAAGRVLFAEGRSEVGQALTVPVIRALKREASGRAGRIIYDAAPGTACPVVAALRDSDFVLLVTEPTPFGLHDLGLACELVDQLRLPSAVVLNQAGPRSQTVTSFCASRGIPVIIEIPFDRRYAEVIANGELISERFPEWRARFLGLWHTIEAMS